jgi:hypothetical protein
MTQAEINANILARAYAAMTWVPPKGDFVRYRLGQGGKDPAGPVGTYNQGKYESDCSGFVAWCCGVRKYRPGFNKGGSVEDYLSTDAIYQDARRGKQLFELVTQGEAMPGDLVVYCGTWKGGKRTGVGHIGIITLVSQDFNPASLTSWTKHILVTHCHGPTGVDRPAITQTDGYVFGKGILRRTGGIVRFKGTP